MILRNIYHYCQWRSSSDAQVNKDEQELKQFVFEQLYQQPAIDIADGLVPVNRFTRNTVRLEQNQKKNCTAVDS